MSEYDLEKLNSLRAWVNEFIGQVSELPLSPDQKTELFQLINEVESELADDYPNIDALRNSFEEVKGIIEGVYVFPPD